MEFLTEAIDFLLHVDRHLSEISQQYKVWTYLILFLIIFSETGLVVTPFLPGDPLLFAAGALVATGETGLNIYLLALILFVAAIAGNFLNYTIGGFFGSKIFKPTNKILKPEYYVKTKIFFRKHGGKAVIFSRFFPVLRTFVPFVAGVGQMRFGLFSMYNLVGGFLWITSFLFLGYLIGNIPIIKDNFGIVIGIIGVATTAPIIIAAIKSRFSKKKRLA
jgi:membrane-associated protein